MAKTEKVGMDRMTYSSLFNQNWFRVRELTPVLAPDVEISRHVYRLQPRYILRRKSTRRWYSMNTASYEVLALFNGHRTVSQVWEILLESQGEHAPDQSQVIQLLSQLHDADMLMVDAWLDTQLLLDRKQRIAQRDRHQRFWNPLYIRFALIDPDRLLDRLNALLPRRFFFALAVCMAALFCTAIVTLVPRWSEFLHHVRGNLVFDPGVIVCLAIVYPVMKLLHELAHALVVKRFGGDVREAGIAMLVLLPNPYVDASAASMFAAKSRRMLVSAAGIAVELSLAAIAVLVWASSGGIIRDVALSVVVLGSVSTVLFNGNPLLKFDGYYILSDFIEIPNLATRSRQYLLGCLARIFGLEATDVPTPVDRNEKYWLFGYAIFSTLYRFALMVSIAWILSGQYFIFGVMLALYIGFSTILKPLWKLLGFALNQTPAARVRLAAVLSCLCLLIGGAAYAVPGPRAVTSDGIVWLPEQSVLRLEQACDVLDVVTEPGSHVEAGQHLFDCVVDDWLAEERLLAAELRRNDAQRAGLSIKDPAQHQLLSDERAITQAQYDLASKRLNSMTVKAAVSGQFLIDGVTELAGRHIPANSVAGYVVPLEQRTIRVALTQIQAGYVTDKVQQAQIFLPHGNVPVHSVVASITRWNPRATSIQSVPALTTLGGGEHRAQNSRSGAMLEQPVFDIELSWPEALPPQLIGSRVRVRFEHQPTSLSLVIRQHIRSLLDRRLSES